MTNGSPNATSLPVQLLAFINTNKLGPIGEVRFFAGCSLNLLWLNVRKWHKADGLDGRSEHPLLTQSGQVALRQQSPI
jgi:hypothetical protein